MGCKIDFLPADKHKIILQVDSITLGVHSQVCPKYPEQQVYKNDEDDLLDSGEHENLLQIDTMILLGMVKHFQGSRNSKFAMSLQYLKNEVRDEVDFLHADKRQSGIQVDFNILGTKFS